MLHPLVKEVLYTRKEIAKRAEILAKEITKYYQQQDVYENTILVIGLLKGCVPFMAEFLNHLEYGNQTDYMVVSSYHGDIKAVGKPEILLDVNTDLENRHILIVEDVIDSGATLKFVKEYFISRGAVEVKILSMIDKPEKRQDQKKAIQADWTGFRVGNHFLIGFGLDCQERLRNLPYVAICDIEKLKNWKWK